MGAWFPFLFVAALYGLNPVTISVYPTVKMAPATFRLTILVPRHFDNRRVCFGVDGPELKRSCFTLDGWQSRKTWTVYWTLRGVGEYTAEAVLTRSVGGRDEIHRSTQPFIVAGAEPAW